MLIFAALCLHKAKPVCVFGEFVSIQLDYNLTDEVWFSYGLKYLSLDRKWVFLVLHIKLKGSKYCEEAFNLLQKLDL